ncbi:hypothetical protein P692DRAFT_20877399 [Suillus brevipes Sb2]|nr:hypothetical protein P692DRAFT_20877399 [Suillus brevipes Sb2]
MMHEGWVEKVNFRSRSLVWTALLSSASDLCVRTTMADKPLKFHFCDPSRGRRKRRMAALRLDGFIHHSFTNGPVKMSTPIEPGRDKTETERDHSGAQNATPEPAAQAQVDAAAAAPAATAPTAVRVDYESSLELDMMGLINWPEE